MEIVRMLISENVQNVFVYKHSSFHSHDNHSKSQAFSLFPCCVMQAHHGLSEVTSIEKQHMNLWLLVKYERKNLCWEFELYQKRLCVMHWCEVFKICFFSMQINALRC